MCFFYELIMKGFFIMNYQPNPEPINNPIPEQGYMRLPAILAIIAVSRASWWRLVKEGKYPQPVKIIDMLGEECLMIDGGSA